MPNNFRLPLFALVVLISGVLSSCSDDKKCYLVEDTGYFHSTKDPQKCHFIDAAKRAGYKIRDYDEESALISMRKICKSCYTQEEQRAYNEKIRRKKLADLYWSDKKAWLFSGDDNGENIRSLYVYIDEDYVLHIDGGCLEATGEKERRRLVETNYISSTCIECVDREYCDLIYQEVFNLVPDSIVYE